MLLGLHFLINTPSLVK
uniref:Uncharacterized protein n=1 Tax=Anguilla anguilla TaxID=7936 RepID=A0A0E9T6Y3_ANGAN